MITRFHDFWFAERDPRDLAAMRITLGVLVLSWWLALTPDLGMWFTFDGPNDPVLLERKIWRIGLLEGLSLPGMRAVHLLGVLVICAYTVGIATPVMNVLLTVLMVAYYHRSPWIQNGGDRLLRIFVFYMCFTDSGRAWSVDAWLRGGTSSASPVFSARLIQIQLAIMYLYTGMAKIPGHTWEQGTAVYYSLMDGGYSRFPWVWESLFAYAPIRGVFAVLTWTTIVWEILFAPLVLFRSGRYLALALGVAIHLGIFATIAVGVFSLSTLWGYLAFLPEGWAAWTLCRGQQLWNRKEV